MGPGLQSRPEHDTHASPAHASVIAPEAAPHANHVAVGAPQGAATIAAAGLGEHGAEHGPSLNSFWNHVFGGAGDQAGDGRPLSQNHIGSTSPGPVEEGGLASRIMRETPYLGDYWEALAVTHDSTRRTGVANQVTAVTDVGIPGPLMGLIDAPFRAFGHSLFLDQQRQ